MPDSIKTDELSFPYNNKDILSIYSINQANTPEVGSLKSVGKLKELLHMSSLVLAARINNKIIGFVVCLEAGAAYTSPNYKYISKKAKKFVYIDRIAIKNQYRRLGVAKSLYEIIFNYSKKSELPIYCEVNTKPKNQASLNFHKKNGFLKIGTKDFRDHSVVYMLKIFCE
jgi:predicted GNAT superfamily acetyltransferase